MRWGRLFRSDALHGLTEADRREVAELGLVSVIDLRTPEEFAEQGRTRVAASHHHLPIADVLPLYPGAEACQAEPDAVAASYHSTLAGSADSVRGILALLADPSTCPAVVCSSAGVDRAGIVSAVVLGLLGVGDDQVVRDYASSREAILRRIGRLRFEHPSAVRHDVDRFGSGLLGVVPEAMARFLSLVRAEHGSMAGYAASIDMAGVVPYLRGSLLEGRAGVGTARAR